MKQLFPNSRGLNEDKNKLKDFKKSSYIYVLSTDDYRVKIGTTSNLWIRLKQLQAGSPQKLTLLMFWLCFDGSRVEASLHTVFGENRLHGEWFHLGSYESDYRIWQYKLITEIAIKTSIKLPIPINSDLYFHIQYAHILNNDPCWDQPWDQPSPYDWHGREFYPQDLFVEFTLNLDSDQILLHAYGSPTDRDEILRNYCLLPRE